MSFKAIVVSIILVVVAWHVGEYLTLWQGGEVAPKPEFERASSLSIAGQNGEPDRVLWTR